MFLVDPKVFRFVVKGGQSHIFGGSKGVGVTIESYGKVEISYINVHNFNFPIGFYSNPHPPQTQPPKIWL